MVVNGLSKYTDYIKAYPVTLTNYIYIRKFKWVILQKYPQVAFPVDYFSALYAKVFKWSLNA